MRQRVSLVDLGLYGTATAAAALVFLGVTIMSTGSSGALVQISIAAFLWISGALFRGVLPSSSWQATVLRSSVVCLLAIAFGLFGPASPDWRILLGVAAVTTANFAVLDLITSLAGGTARSGAEVLGAFLLFISAPVWLGPFAVGNEHLLTALIWSNPCVLVALQAGIDLFRTELLYGLSPIGDVRYVYPDAMCALLLPLGPVLALSAASMYRIDRATVG